MLHFFRKIRRDLIEDSQFFKYLKYAVGEIILVVLGILIALQINNWNEKRRNDILFKESMEQVYNGLKTDVDYYNFLRESLIDQNETIDLLLENPESQNKYEQAHALHDVVWDFIRLKTTVEYFTRNLIYNPDNKQQRSLSKRLAGYVLENKNFQSSIDIDMNQILTDKGLPRYNNIMDRVEDSTYYSEEQLLIASELIHCEDIRNTLKTIKIKALYDLSAIGNFENEARSIMANIKAYYPDVRILFENIGIIGTSIDGWDDVAMSTPMKEPEFGVFETELFLKEGDVKFRSNDSWIQNWGGDTFPEGAAIQDGNNIHVDQSGKYLIRIDLNSNRYYFTKLD